MGGFDHQERNEHGFAPGIEAAHPARGACSGFEEACVDVVEEGCGKHNGSLGMYPDKN